MVQVLVPIATLDPGEWTVSGAPTLHEALDEGTDTPDDAGSYAQAFGGFAAGLVKLAPGVAPASSSGWQLKVRCTIFIGGGGQNMRVRLFEGATLLLTWSPFCSLGTWNTRVLDIDPAAVAGVSDFSDLRVELFTSALPLFDFFRVSTVDLHLPDPPATTDDPLVADELEVRLRERARPVRAGAQAAGTAAAPAGATSVEVLELEAQPMALAASSTRARAVGGRAATAVAAFASSAELEAMAPVAGTP